MLLLVYTVCLTLLAILVRGTLPRYRLDQVITLHWKVIAILLFLFFLITAVSTYLYSL